MVLYIAGDIGGTNARLQLVRAKRHGAHVPEQQRGEGEVLVGEFTYPSQKYKTFSAIVAEFIGKYKPAGEQIYCMCLAVAGPVNTADNSAQITNVVWKIDGLALAREFKLEHVRIMNDFEGNGYGLLALKPDQLEAVYTPPATDAAGRAVPAVDPTGVRAVIGAGTGLGEAFLTHNGTEYKVYPCEGGHTDFAPRDALEFAIQQHILQSTPQLDRVSTERVVSGLGIPKIYEYLALTRPADVNPQVAALIKSGSQDVGRVVAESAKSGVCRVCVDAMDIFTRSYGAEAGNLCLKTLPFGGLYIAGGIAAKNMAVMRKNDQFVRNYLSKGRMRAVLQRIPVYLITEPQVGMLGSKVICRRIIHEGVGNTSQQQTLRSRL